MKFYSEAAMERAMKVQEVILRAMAKRMAWQHGFVNAGDLVG